MEQLKNIVEISSIASDFERALILAYTQGLNRGIDLGREQLKKELAEKQLREV
jgi:hypothetical protein